MAAPDWLAALDPAAPDVVAVWRLIDTDFRATRRAMRHRAGPGSAERVLAQQEAVADALESALAGLPDGMLPRPPRRAVRHRAGPGSAERVLAQQEAVADALESALAGIPDEMLRAPGGEEDWNVAQTFAHTTGARRWLGPAGAWAAPRVV